ncbi:Dyslexia susceptibility 1 candidate protein [Fasciola gigantica]|uniref:Dyslexia susceptibility 1 candidate protein n=1 Tax=Fasciola gigantica TaxID=46835 RepID=A0A504YJH8_FASGI|nr:Dyslexia susceptibility 1 candidate protein [Fasciola gigantica]
MYLSIIDYSWNETLDEVIVEVPLRGLPISGADIMTTSKYLKMVIKPYIFECALYGAITAEHSRVELGDNCARFVLKKTRAERWGRLTSEAMNDKKEFQKIKEEAILEFQKLENAREKKNKTQVREGEKQALNELMRIEGCERDRIAREKKDAGDRAMEELVKFHEEEQRRKQKLQLQIEEAKKVAKGMCEERRIRNVPVALGTTKEASNSTILAALLEKPCELPIRESNKISVSFTPRVFPTPERESTKREEEEWLSKQAEYRRSLMKRVVAGGEFSEQEQDPIWLRGKGDSLFRAGDYEAAVIAYTQAISLNPKLYSYPLS